MKSLKEQLVEILVQSNLLTDKQLHEAEAIQKAEGGKLSQILVDKKFVDEKDMMCALSEHLQIPPVDLSKVQVEPSVIALIPKDTAYFYQLLPISEFSGTLTIAMADPLNVFALDDLKLLTGMKINPVISTAKGIADALGRYYASTPVKDAMFSDVDIAKVNGDAIEKDLDVDKLVEEAGEAPVVRAVNFMVANAVKDRASDIHLEPYQDTVRLRFRIDGVLYEKATFPKRLHAPMISRIKIMSDMDITEKRLPQDGRFRIKTKGRFIDFRVSTLPTSYGEKAVLRILDKVGVKLDIHKLGFHDQGLEILEKSLKAPYGMILVTGPTGSGKTTTLYAALCEINKPTVNIITVEDPVEFQIGGVNQVQVHAEIGLSFANCLRSILRQDPNVIMVGEIRDHETAEIAVKAALTGHLVLSTLHTNDAPGAITRLIDMGVEPFLLSSAVLMVAAQRLARKICPSCKQLQAVTQEILMQAQMQIVKGEEVKIYKGRGCERCFYSGYQGRISLIEVLPLSEELRDMIVKRRTSGEIKKFALEHGMKTLRMVGLNFVREGLTTLEEVLRETAPD